MKPAIKWVPLSEDYLYELGQLYYVRVENGEPFWAKRHWDRWVAPFWADSLGFRLPQKPTHWAVVGMMGHRPIDMLAQI